MNEFEANLIREDPTYNISRENGEGLIEADLVSYVVGAQHLFFYIKRVPVCLRVLAENIRGAE